MELVQLPASYEVHIKPEGWGWSVSAHRIFKFGKIEFKVEKFKVWDSKLDRAIHRIMTGLRGVA